MKSTERGGSVPAALPKLEAAKLDVEQAATSLEALLADLRVAPRAEKTAVSSAIEDALSRLRHAQTKLVEAQRAVSLEAGVTR
jgi:hypothetical protein